MPGGPRWGALWQPALDFLAPPVCLFCTSTAGATVDPAFCEPCQSTLAPPVPFRCVRCSAPVGPYVNTQQGCIHCGSDRLDFAGVVSLGPYEGALRQACLRCKRGGQSPLTRGLTRLLVQREHTTLSQWSPDVVVPVPHFWIDRLLRPAHAADAVAEALGRFLMVPVDRHILLKVRWTKQQLRLSASARRGNLRNAFRIARSARIQGLNILLADDILTTGTTAQRATRELLQAGAASVYVAVLARGIRT